MFTPAQLKAWNYFMDSTKHDLKPEQYYSCEEITDREHTAKLQACQKVPKRCISKPETALSQCVLCPLFCTYQTTCIPDKSVHTSFHINSLNMFLLSHNKTKSKLSTHTKHVRWVDNERLQVLKRLRAKMKAVRFSTNAKSSLHLFTEMYMSV